MLAIPAIEKRDEGEESGTMKLTMAGEVTDAQGQVFDVKVTITGKMDGETISKIDNVKM